MGGDCHKTQRGGQAGLRTIAVNSQLTAHVHGGKCSGKHGQHLCGCGRAGATAVGGGGQRREQRGKRGGQRAHPRRVGLPRCQQHGRHGMQRRLPRLQPARCRQSRRGVILIERKNRVRERGDEGAYRCGGGSEQAVEHHGRIHCGHQLSEHLQHRHTAAGCRAVKWLRAAASHTMACTALRELSGATLAQAPACGGQPLAHFLP